MSLIAGSNSNGSRHPEVMLFRGATSIPDHCLHQLSCGRGHSRRWALRPDLTHLMSRETIAAGAALNTPENLRLWIQKPDAIKPGSLMPAME